MGGGAQVPANLRLTNRFQELTSGGQLVTQQQQQQLLLR
eukprot:gene22929-62688_t